MDGAKTVTATCGTGTPVTITAAPANVGLKVTVDGTSVDTPFTTSWTPESRHTLTALATQQIGGTEYGFRSWSPGGLENSTINVTAPASPATYTANYAATGYRVTVNVTPANSCSFTLSPAAPASGYYAAGSRVTIAASANQGFAFQNFTGSVTGSTSPQTFVVDAPQTIAVNCTQASGISYTVNATPTGAPLQVSVNGGSAVNMPTTPNCQPRVTQTLAVTTPQPPNATTTRYTFLNWTGATSTTPSISFPCPVEPGNVYTANFRTQHRLNTTHNQGSAPEFDVSESPSSTNGFYDAGTTVRLTASTKDTRYVFAFWQGDLTGSVNPASIVMSSPKNITAVFEPLPSLNFGLSQKGGDGTPTGYQMVGRVGNTGATFDDVRITAIAWAVVSGQGTIVNTTTFPVTAGTIASLSSSGTVTLRANIPTSVNSFTCRISGTARSTVSGTVFNFTDTQNGSLVYTR